MQLPSQPLHGRALDTARAAFADGVALPSALLPESVARSWARSREIGLRPWDAPSYEPLALADRASGADVHRQVRKCVADEIEQLWRAFGGDDWTIFFVDPRGAIVHARRSPLCREAVLQPIEAGRRIQERDIGTTAPSCVMHDGAEIVVAGPQHYLREFERVFCLAVPLFGVDGEPLGALDITGVGRRDPAMLGPHFRMAALSVQQRLFAGLRHCHLLQLQHDPRWLDTPMAGVLAVEDEGMLRAASRPARHMLGLPEDGPLPAVDLRRLFGDAPSALRRRLLRPARTPLRVACADGSHLWVRCVRAPLGTPGAAFVPNVPSVEAAAEAGAASLREQALETTLRALRDNEGNVAATARQLRISRTTLYAKLREMRQAGLIPR